MTDYEAKCPGCGEHCDEDFCFCEYTCSVCGAVAEQHSLGIEQFTFTIMPNDLPSGDYQDCWHPDTHMAFWDESELIVANPHTGEYWDVLGYEPQRRAASRQYYTWYCTKRAALDKCDEGFMREISS